MRLALLALWITAACSSAPGDDGDGGFPFKASNIDVDALDFSNVGDLVISDDKTWMTDGNGLLGSSNAGAYNFQIIDQPGGLSLGVFTVNSIEVTQNALVHVEGVNALVIVALDSISIEGEIDANSQLQGGWTGPGGAASTSELVKGRGPGGGGTGTLSAAGGGAGFCGVGGTGGSETTVASAGPSYGTAALIPLVGGSQGGSGNLGNGGAGGGAIQLVSGGVLQILGTVHLGAEGGYGSGVYSMNNSQTASGGGSGGGLLLEAGDVVISGIIAANGGGGGGDDSGGDARPDPIPAAGGASTSATATPGGEGAAGDVIDGEDGPSAAGANGGGGGGAAGRIRINTDNPSDLTQITGALSPSLATPCATTGLLVR
jgi:hypothetical protein